MEEEKKQSNNNLFPEMEKEVLNFWDKNKIFEKSVKKEAPKGDYTFYDGPPFATGLPHYGHLVASIMKDAVPRYWTMKGYRVERRWGWDCHGLPVENLAEKELNLKDKTDIEKIGVPAFNEYCESIVMRYATEWKKTIHRIGRWVDMENDYKTMDPEYMESIWWVFKNLWEKDLIYKGYKAMHICPRCGTTLSNFEVTQNYQDVKDLSAIVKFELVDEPGTFVLAWTTTPWTLIGNVALAVNEKINYSILELATSGIRGIEEGKGERLLLPGKYIVATDLVEKINKEGNYFTDNIKIIKGKDLVGKKYIPIFDYYASDEKLKNRENGWKIYPADFVTTDEGTGVVHIAPAFGEDDLNLGQQYNLPFIQHVDTNGRIKPDAKDFAGLEVKPKGDTQATDVEIIKYLARNGLLFSKEKYEHSYPLCWRCDTPLLNYATESWFIAVTKFRDELIKSNANVNWVPEHIKEGRFGKWLEQARDWAISRNRYWGAPLPVWVCDKCGETKIIGSRAELEKLSGKEVKNLHKQFVDIINFKCDKCDGTMKRIPEVLDCWFESGSMPYAQNHYMGKALPDFDPEIGLNFPAEFIAEGVDQTRGWFYTLMVLGTALYGKSPYKHVIVNGIVLAEDGQKMSKRLRNYPDPAELFEKYSVDSMRYYLLASPVLVAENLNFSESGVNEILRKVEMLLWNVYRFYEMYASELKVESKIVESENILDQWILARLNQLIKEATENMDAYVLPKAIRPIGEFINDLSTWYIRRSRDRFKGDDLQDKENAIRTTGFVLSELAKIMAPFTPFIAEQLWQKVNGFNFTDENKSVHLEDWPSFAETKLMRKKQISTGKAKMSETNIQTLTGKAKLIFDEMELVRKIVSMGLLARDASQRKIRQPLSEIRLGNEYKMEEKYLSIIKDELNVKEITYIEEAGLIDDRDKDWQSVLDSRSPDYNFYLNIKITPELELEGIKRDLVRAINNLRKDSGLTIQDKANIYWQTDSSLIKEVLEKQKLEILKDTLSLDILPLDEKSENKKEIKINGELIIIGINKV